MYLAVYVDIGTEIDDKGSSLFPFSSISPSLYLLSIRSYILGIFRPVISFYGGACSCLSCSRFLLLPSLSFAHLTSAPLHSLRVSTCIRADRKEERERERKRGGVFSRERGGGASSPSSCSERGRKAKKKKKKPSLPPVHSSFSLVVPFEEEGTALCALALGEADRLRRTKKKRKKKEKKSQRGSEKGGQTFSAFFVFL